MIVLHERIKEQRVGKGLSQRELGDLFGITQQAVGRWETGQALPDATTLGKLADYFNVSVDYLLGRKIVTQDHPDPNISRLLRNHGIKKLQLMENYSLEDIKKLVELGDFLRDKKTGD